MVRQAQPAVILKSPCLRRANRRATLLITHRPRLLQIESDVHSFFSWRDLRRCRVLTRSLRDRGEDTDRFQAKSNQNDVRTFP